MAHTAESAGEASRTGEVPRRRWQATVALAALAVAMPAAAMSMPSRTAVPSATEGRVPSLTSYRVVPLDSLGGTYSAGSSINDRNWVAGPSSTAGDRSRHAALWRGNRTTDLGTLGGRSSSVVWPVRNVRGAISGISDTRRIDPLNEDWSCSFFLPESKVNHTCRGFFWRNGKMRALPTLGGNNGFATGTNNRLQTVGWAENTVRDKTCVAPQVLQFRAVVWSDRGRHVRELRPLRGDTVSAATAINDRGQVVGISGICDQAAGRYSAIHAVLWEDGRATSLGTLGGVAWNTPMALNDRGDVVGFSNVSADDGGDFNAEAFLWTHGGGMRALGVLPGDATSQALGINERRQVVGVSCSEGFVSCRAFLWEHGEMVDLNSLTSNGDERLLYAANDINNAGEITGESVEASGESVAFRAEPATAAPFAPRAVPQHKKLPDQVRESLLMRFGLKARDL